MGWCLLVLLCDSLLFTCHIRHNMMLHGVKVQNVQFLPTDMSEKEICSIAKIILLVFIYNVVPLCDIFLQRHY